MHAIDRVLERLVLVILASVVAVLGLTGPVSANTPATGLPIIEGAALVGETLTVDTSRINDSDGLSMVRYSYRWLANDTPIQGATNSSYTVLDTDVGKAIKVQVDFMDDAGNPETATSEATSAVAVPNAQPEVVPRLREWRGGAGNFALSATPRVVVSATDGAKYFSGDYFSAVLGGLTDPEATGLTDEQRLAARLALADSVHATAYHTSSRRTLDEVAAKIRDDIGELTGLTLTAVTASVSVTPQAGDVVVDVLDASDAEIGSEGYELEVGEWVTIRANSTSGVFYGSRTLLQMLALSGNQTAPRGTARDYPTVGHRLIHLDANRKYWEMDYVADSFRRMSWVKLNAFKLHFADANGWRLHDPGTPAWSGTVSVTPTAGTGSDVSATSSQGAPTAVRVTPGDGLLTVHWQPPDAASNRVVRSYRVQIRARGDSEWSPVDYRDSAGVGTAYLTVEDRSHTLSGLTNGVTHQLRVSADTGFPGLADSREQYASGDKKWFYDRDDILRLENWAAEHHILIMPGFEFPGHTSVINDLYETGFADGGGDRCGEAHVYGNVKPGFVLDTTSSRAVAQTRAIMEHFMPWFPGPYVHIGGEEVSAKLANCPRVSAHIAATSSVASLGDMLTVFFNDLNALVRGTGRSMIIYNGVEALSPNTNVARLDSTVSVMDWNASTYNYYGGRPGSSGARHAFIKMRTADGQYLTPNNFHALYPDESRLYDRWNVEPVSTYQGAAIGVWLDYIYWSQDEYTELLLRRPRAILADRTWNGTATPDSVRDFYSRFDAVGEPPGYVGFGDRTRVHDGEPSHHYGFEDDTEVYPPSHFKNLRPSRTHLLRDEAGALHATSYNVTSPTVSTADKVAGAASWRFESNGHGAGIGGVDISAPWTVSVWVKRTANRVGAALLSSRSPGGQHRYLRLQRSGTHVGVDNYDGVGCTFNYSTPLNHWTHLAFVADGAAITLYVNGVARGGTCAAMPLPMGAISARGANSLRAHVDELKIWDEALSRAQVQRLSVLERPPAMPSITTVTARDGALLVTWAAPTAIGSGLLTSYDLRSIRTDATEAQKAIDANWAEHLSVWTSTAGGDRQAIIGSLANDVSYDVQVRATNIVDHGDWSETRTGTPAIQNGTPAFADETTTRNVAENTAAGQPIGALVTATDPESDTLTYSLESGDELFDIDARTGRLRTEAALDHEVADSHTVVVGVSDMLDSNDEEDAEVDDTITVTVIVDDVDEAADISLEPGSRVSATGNGLGVAENHTGTVATFTPSDPENKIGLTYMWSLGGTDRLGFAVTAAGELTFDQTPDYERPADSGGDNVYNLTVNALDSDGLTGRIDVTVAVEPVNEPPIISGDTTPAIEEDGTVLVATYTATDPERATLAWEPLAGTDSDKFEFDVTNGRLTFEAVPDFENAQDLGRDNVYELTLSASADGDTATLDVEAAVTNKDEDGSLDLSSRQPQAGADYTATLSDPDGVQSTTWTWERSTSRRGPWAAVTGATSRITTSAYTPAGGDVGYYLRATARYTDGHGPSKSLDAVSANQVRAAPVANNPPAFNEENPTRSVAENAGAGTAVSRPVTAMDPDADDVLRYEFEPPGSDLFTIDGHSGQIRVKAARTLDYDDPANRLHTVTAKASDSSNVSDTVDVEITVDDVNEPPNAAADAPARFDEDTEVAIDVLANDSDPEDDRSALTLIVFTSGHNAPRNGRATVNEPVNAGDNRTITYTPNENYNGSDIFIYEVRDTASPRLSSTASVSVQIDAVNDGPTFASPTTARAVAESAAAGDSVGTPVTAIDIDEGDTLMYSLSGADASSFAVDANGQITVRAGVTFDRSTKNTYTVTVEARDTGGETARVMVMITVTPAEPVSIGPGPPGVGFGGGGGEGGGGGGGGPPETEELKDGASEQELARLAADRFEDVDTDDYFAPAVGWMLTHGITVGCDDDSFCVGRPVTRQHFVVFLWRAAGEPEPSQPGSQIFEDVTEGGYANEAIGWAFEQGVTVGCFTDDSDKRRFCPHGPSTRAHISAFLHRYAGAQHPSDRVFADVDPSSYYAAAVAWMHTHGITTGCADDSFCPHKPATRAHAGTFIYRIAIRPDSWGTSGGILKQHGTQPING